MTISEIDMYQLLKYLKINKHNSSSNWTSRLKKIANAGVIVDQTDSTDTTKLTVPKQASQWVALIWKSAYLYPISKRPKPMSEEE